MQVVLGPGGQHERDRAAVRRLGRGADAVGRVVQLVDRVVAVAGEVLDRPAGQSLCDGVGDGRGDALRLVGEAVLEIGGHRDVDRFSEEAAVGENLLAASWRRRGGHA